MEIMQYFPMLSFMLPELVLINETQELFDIHAHECMLCQPLSVHGKINLLC